MNNQIYSHFSKFVLFLLKLTNYIHIQYSIKVTPYPLRCRFSCHNIAYSFYHYRLNITTNTQALFLNTQAVFLNISAFNDE